MIPLLESTDAFWANVSFIGTFVLIALGAAWQFVILPNLRRDHPTNQAIVDQNAEQLQLLKRAVDQLTKNGGKNDPATVPDVAHELREFRREVHAQWLRDEQRWVEHRAWSDAQLAKKADR